MAQTYSQVTKQIEALQSKAAQLKEREIAGVVQRIHVAIKAYGLTANDLFGTKSTTPRSAAKPGKRVAKQRYADGNGNSWGGMGPRPQWLRTALAEGKTLEQFIDGGATPSSPTEAASAKAPKQARASSKRAGKAGKRGKKRSARQGYASGSDTWSGHGRQPQWMKDALAGGKTLDELKAPAAN